MAVLDVNILTLDATFIEGHSRREPEDSPSGLSDIEVGSRKHSRNVVLGHGVHLVADLSGEMR